MADEKALEIDKLEESLEKGSATPAAPKPSAAPAAGSTVALKATIGVLAVGCIVLLATTIYFSEEVDRVEKLNALATTKPPGTTNVCAGKKQTTIPTFNNIDCLKDGVVQASEQSGVNVTKGYQGSLNAVGTPITTPYWKQGLCPVNVHWHLGAEHFSAGEYDVPANGLPNGDDGHAHRRLAAGKTVREGYNCHYYNSKSKAFTEEYDWKHCVGMHVGETYEVHWPHSRAGMCGTVDQFQTPFYDGVFCNGEVVGGLLNGSDPRTTSNSIGVQAQVFQIINDESYYYPDLMRGMIVDGNKGSDMAIYTGSTTGTSRNNKICSFYTPITWQVDRKCHLISASTFDKMCADMKAQRDDMSDDLHAHGARELVASSLSANNQVTGTAHWNGGEKTTLSGWGTRKH